MSMFYVERNRNEVAFSVLIGCFIGAGHSERLAWSPFDLVQHKTKSYSTKVGTWYTWWHGRLIVFPKVDVQCLSRSNVVCYCATKCEWRWAGEEAHNTWARCTPWHTDTNTQGSQNLLTPSSLRLYLRRNKRFYHLNKLKNVNVVIARIVLQTTAHQPTQTVVVLQQISDIIAKL